MNFSRIIQFADKAIKFKITSAEILQAVDVHFAHCMVEEGDVICEYQVGSENEAAFSIHKDGQAFASNFNREQILFHLMQDGLTALNGAATSHLIFHAAGLAFQKRGLLLCGQSGSGKSTLAAWLVSKGFQYLSDEVMALPLSGGAAHGFSRSLVLKPGSATIWERWLTNENNAEVLKMNDGSVWIAPTLLNLSSVCKQMKTQVIIFPTYAAEAEFNVESLRPAGTLFMLMQCLVNARNFDEHGLKSVKELAQNVSAYQLVYSNIEQASEWIQRTLLH